MTPLEWMLTTLLHSKRSRLSREAVNDWITSNRQRRLIRLNSLDSPRKLSLEAEARLASLGMALVTITSGQWSSPNSIRNWDKLKGLQLKCQRLLVLQIESAGSFRRASRVKIGMLDSISPKSFCLSTQKTLAVRSQEVTSRLKPPCHRIVTRPTCSR